MPYCENCGTYLPQDASFCPGCGAENKNYVPAEQVSQPDVIYSDNLYKSEAQPQYGPTQGTNGLAIAGMVLAFCFAPVGIILSAIALKRARSGDYRNPLEGLAKAGLIVSIIMTILGVILCIVYAALIIRYLDGNYSGSWYY